eukprot:EC120394.1.p1 GENE.EC120394.1~~EC120394.1.p1  ORF type:complete len:140 (+),score=10.41 EC120394.1:96-515(+)
MGKDLEIGSEGIAYTTLSAAAAILVYSWQSFKVGEARRQYGIKAPAMSGNADFERVFRAHQNTAENLTPFLASLYGFSIYVSPKYGSALGLVWSIARVLYHRQYAEDAASRGKPFVVGWVTQTVLLLGTVGGAIYTLLK